MEIVNPIREIHSPSLRFEVAPAYDLVISLAAVADPERFELSSSWALQVRSSLSASVRKDVIFFFGDPLPIGVGPIQLVPQLSSCEPEVFIHALERLDSPDFAVAMLGRNGDDRRVAPAIRRAARGRMTEADISFLADHAASMRSETRKRFQSILDDPRDAQQRYTRLLRAHADGWFRTRYVEVSPFLQQRAKQARRSVGKLPTKEVIARATKGFTLQSPARSVTLAPSYYAAPFVFVVRGGKDAVLVYGARPSEDVGRATMDADTIRVLKALADETRLRILQVLSRRSLYGQQLAEMLGVSHPTISHHMAQLRIAGLTRTELTEDGSKTYSVRRETVEKLRADLSASFLESEVEAAEIR